MKTAIYPGTFDPITFGHIDVIKKSLKLFEKIIVAVSDGENKKYLFDFDEKIESTTWPVTFNTIYFRYSFHGVV